MNIFWLAIIEAEAARAHCDKHVVKMIVETAQLLYAAFLLLSSSVTDMLHTEFKAILDQMDSSEKLTCWVEEEYKPYRISHQGHPALIWVMESSANFQKLCNLGIELEKEYCRRYNKVHHKCYIHILLMQKVAVLAKFPSHLLTNPPLCMPEQCRQGFGHYQFITDDLAGKGIPVLFRASSWESAVEAYKRYYTECKFDFVKYAHNTPTPEWFSVGDPEAKRKRNLEWAEISAKRDKQRLTLSKKAKTIATKLYKEENSELHNQLRKIFVEMKEICKTPEIYL